MSSATSTDRARSNTDAGSVTTNEQLRPTTNNQQLQPWQFFVLAALGCATAATFMARGRGITAVVMLSLMMGGAAMIGMAALRALRPLVSPDDDHAAILGQRTRAALERDKLLALRAIKELEFDRAMGKVSLQDFDEMAGRLRSRAMTLMKQLDEGQGYRSVIERELQSRAAAVKPRAAYVCACGTSNDADAKFCKSCGSKLA
jgi:hypothetical protein